MVSAVENTVGVWDGAVPIVQAIPVPAPIGSAAKAISALVLHINRKRLKKGLALEEMAILMQLSI